jgi:hypothetical protein
MDIGVLICSLTVIDNRKPTDSVKISIQFHDNILIEKVDLSVTRSRLIYHLMKNDERWMRMENEIM